MEILDTQESANAAHKGHIEIWNAMVQGSGLSPAECAVTAKGNEYLQVVAIAREMYMEINLTMPVLEPSFNTTAH